MINNIKNAVFAFGITYLLNKWVNKDKTLPNYGGDINEFDHYITKVIDFEGRKCETDPDDPGGTTKFGIAKAFYPNKDICGLTEDDAKRIFYDDYWAQFHCPYVSKHIRFLFLDTCVLQGGGFAIRTLQKLTGAKVDGIIGHETITKSVHADLREYSQARKENKIQRIVEDSDLEKFRDGWMKRIDAAEAFQRNSA